MWSSACGTSNVWIAETVASESRLRLVRLRRVQELDRDRVPFNRLEHYLRQSDFDVAAIDAPFSISSEYLRSRTHRELLDLVGNIELRGGRPFPSAQDFVDRLFEGMTPVTKKPLRRSRGHGGSSVTFPTSRVRQYEMFCRLSL
jgi:hypothetical protein